MTDNVLHLRTDTNLIRVMINDDPGRVIQFDPSDVTFAERFYKLIGDFETKQAEYQARSEKLDAERNRLDHNGLPENLGEGLAFMREVCEYMHGQIDYLFGAGTSLKAFAGSLSIEAIGEFFDGITPFIQKTRSEKVAKYAPAKQKGRVMK